MDFIDFERLDIFTATVEQQPNQHDSEFLRTFAGSQLRPFDGRDRQSLLAFEEGLERIKLQRPSLSEVDLVRIGMSKCEGFAFSLVREEEPSELTVAKLMSILKKGCGVSEDLSTAEVKLTTCRQKKGEKVNIYCQRITGYSRELDRCEEPIEGESKEVRKKRRQAQLSRYFEQGLLAPLQSAVRNSRVTTIDEKFEVAQREETALARDPSPTRGLIAALESAFVSKKELAQHSAAKSDQPVADTVVPVAAVAQQQGTSWQHQPHDQGYASQVYWDGVTPHSVNYAGQASFQQPPPIQGYQPRPAHFQQPPPVHFQQPQPFQGYQPRPQRQHQHPARWNQQYQPQQDGRFRQQQAPLKNNIQCYNCRGFGHISRDCNARPANQQSIAIGCEYCQSPNHTMKDCNQVPCNICNGKGHRPTMCPKALPAPNSQQQQPRPQGPPSGQQRSLTYHSKNL